MYNNYCLLFRKYVSKGQATGKWLLTVGSDAEDAPDYKGILIKASQSGNELKLHSQVVS